MGKKVRRIMVSKVDTMAKKINQEIYKRNRSFNKLEFVINLFFNDKITRRGIAEGKYVFRRLKNILEQKKTKKKQRSTYIRRSRRTI